MKLQYLSADTDAQEIQSQLEKHGALIIEEVIDQTTVDHLKNEINPFIANVPTGRDDFTGFNTQRMGALVSRSATCRSLITNALILGAASKYLAPFTSKILLNLAAVIKINPSSEAQVLHRDRLAWGKYLPSSIEPQFNTIWALTDFTRENGATRCVPGSHRWDWSQKAEAEQIAYCEMPAGSVFIYNGSVLHGGGANQSNASRIGVNLAYCLGWLRQEENQYLCCPPDIAKHFDTTLQNLLGYTQGEYALGYYSDPYSKDEVMILEPEKALLG
ncbi:MAG: phytanoyl-CoA dioxygenase family protein [Pseudomonadota bacterium]|nr:phytanoyl-CoA dioxygenase family protein [Pseudomonadota bacterium]